jgi:hypothetical protein
MEVTMRMRALLFGCVFLVGCGVAEGGPGGGGSKSALSGTWFSGGNDMAKGFGGPPFNFASLKVLFDDDGSYSVKATDTKQKTIDFTGTWIATASATPGLYEIEQRQIMPQAVVSKGIYQLDQASGRLTFEIIQTQPDVGAAPPTVMGGFGSTTVKGMKTDAWIQKYVRQ